MRIGALLTVYLSLLLSHVAAHGEGFICAVEQAAGFSFDKASKTWEATTFKANRRYLFRRPLPLSVPEGKHAWEVVELGQDISTSWCESDFSQYGVLVCDGISTFKLNRNTLRFIHVYAIGFWSDDPKEKNSRYAEGENTPHMEIGTCSTI